MQHAVLQSAPQLCSRHGHALQSHRQCVFPTGFGGHGRAARGDFLRIGHDAQPLRLPAQQLATHGFLLGPRLSV